MSLFKKERENRKRERDRGERKREREKEVPHTTTFIPILEGLKNICRFLRRN